MSATVTSASSAVSPGFFVVEGDDAVGLDTDHVVVAAPGRFAGVGVDPGGHVDGDDRGVALVRQPRRGPFRLSERAGNSASEHRVDDHVRIVEREVGGVGDGLGGDRGALEGVPVLASDLGPDRLGRPSRRTVTSYAERKRAATNASPPLFPRPQSSSTLAPGSAIARTSRATALPDDSISCFRGTPRAAALASTAAIRSVVIMPGYSHAG